LDGLESVVLQFFVASSGELRCRVTDIYSRRTWMVPSARAVFDLLRFQPGESHEREETK
jgi:hypothetical protein